MTAPSARKPTPEEEELAHKLRELEELESQLAERELELATLIRKLHQFERRYLATLGPLYAELDDLRAQIAEALARQAPHDPEAQRRAAEARARAQGSAQEAQAYEPAPGRDRAEPSPELKRLYREVAGRVHPDLTTDDQERQLRARLMAEANRAYEEGDEERLRAILEEWERSPQAVQGEGVPWELVRVIRKIAQVRARLEAIAAEMAALRESPLYALMVEVEEAAAQGRDLLAEMAAALRAEIAEARRLLNRIISQEQRV